MWSVFSEEWRACGPGACQLFQQRCCWTLWLVRPDYKQPFLFTRSVQSLQSLALCGLPSDKSGEKMVSGFGIERQVDDFVTSSCSDRKTSGLCKVTNRLPADNRLMVLCCFVEATAQAFASGHAKDQKIALSTAERWLCSLRNKDYSYMLCWVEHKTLSHQRSCKWTAKCCGIEQLFLVSFRHSLSIPSGSFLALTL